MMARMLAKPKNAIARNKAIRLTRHELSSRLLGCFEELLYHPGTSGNTDVHYQDRDIRGAVCCTPAEAMLMYHVARLRKPARALEIGSYIGWSSAHLASGLENCELVCVEPFLETGGSPAAREKSAANAQSRFCQNIQRAGVAHRIKLIREKSPDVIPSLSANLTWDLAFVDGWHLQGQPLKDVIGVLPFVSRDAILLLHDTWIADVRDALLYLATQGWSYRIFDTANYLTILWRGAPPAWLGELSAIGDSSEFVLPVARGRKFVFGLVEDSIAEASRAFGGEVRGV